MEHILLEYRVNEPTWFYLSFLLIVAVFFKFSRLWSMRNLDLALLLVITPGLLLIEKERATGYTWLFATSGLLLIRSLLDGVLVRRPRRETNMNAAGMTFLCAATFVFLTTKVLTEPPPPSLSAPVRQISASSEQSAIVTVASHVTEAPTTLGPASPLITAPVVQLSRATTGQWDVDIVASRTLVILAHLSVVIGLILVGYHLFTDVEMGVAMGTMYMLLPCTSHDVAMQGMAFHVLPAALIVWAIWAYRRPMLSGTFIGVACGILFFPIFLLPLWCAFYGWRGTLRFLGAVALVAGVLVAGQLLMTSDAHSFLRQTLGYLDSKELQFGAEAGAAGFWQVHHAAYRIPVFATYVLMLLALVIWPHRKNLANLIGHSAAIVIGIQFWYLQQNGAFVLWYLPLMILLMFRPQLAQHGAPSIEPLLRNRAGGTVVPEQSMMAGFTRSWEKWSVRSHSG